MSTNFNNYGRRLVKWSVAGTDQVVYTLSGQWVGHSYGNEFGTQRQRKNATPETGSVSLEGVSTKILWNYSGNAGDIVDVSSDFFQKFLEKTDWV